MISSLIDELRKSEDEWNGSNMFELARMCREAADTIWELRDDLQRANAENAKLRELCRKFAEYVSQDRCEGCVCKHRCNDGEIDECWQLTEIRKAAYELGIEVDG